MNAYIKPFFRIAFTAVLFLTSYYLFAPPSTPGGGSPPACWPPPCVPIDGGITILLAAGAALGLKKSYDYLKSDKKVEE